MTSRAIFLLIAAGASWLLAFNSGRDLIFNLAYLLTGILGLSYAWAWFSIRFVEINRYTQARRSQVGQTFEETFEVINRSRLPKLWLELRDYSTLPFHDVSQVLNNMRSGESERWSVRTLCQQRGYYRLGPMSLHSGDPLGLFEMTQVLPETSALVIYPGLVDLPHFQPPVADLAGGEALSRRAQYLTTNVAGIREYAPGDSFNRIHWLSTARMGRLITKEFELDPAADIWIALDMNERARLSLPWQLSRPEFSIFSLAENRRRRDSLTLPPHTTEYMVTIAASIARYYLLRNRAVGMVWYDRRRYSLQLDRGERQLRKILEILAVVQAEGNLPFGQVLATEGMSLNRNNTLVAISPDPSPTWAKSLREVRRRGVNSIAVCLAPDSFGGRYNASPVLQELRVINVPTFQIRQGDDLEQALGGAARNGG